ncbi:MAG TPA: BatD family protein [Puia sp.]|nr:BatD family protein [Puia sp.]
MGMNLTNQYKSLIIISILRSRLIFLLISVIATEPVFAQLKFTAITSSKEIGRGDYVQVEFVIENAHQIEHLTHPSFQDFNIVQGPIQSSGMSVINGTATQYKALSFVLQPLRTGKFTIPGATATVDGKAMHSNSVTIHVSANGSTNNNSAQSNPRFAWPGEPEEIDREYFLKPGENISEKIRKNLFVKVDVSKTNCYVGEPIVATYKLYSRVQSESRVIKHPSLNGFSVYDMIDPNSDVASVERVNGKPFTVHVIRKAQLIPLQAGTVQLDPVEVENTVHFLKNVSAQKKHSSNSLQDFFDDLTDDNAEGIPVEQDITLESKPVTISVKPLPEEKKPADFNGAVGHFTVSAGVENKNISAQDAAVLKVTVKGNGNLPVVNAPVVDWPANTETYDPTAKEDIDKTEFPLGGSKTFEYSFIPKQTGDFNIPSIQLSYFDPQSSSYKTVQSQPVNLSVGIAKRKKNNLYIAPGSQQIIPTSNYFLSFLKDHLEWFFTILILTGLAAYLWLQNIKLKKDRKAVQPVVQAVTTPAPTDSTPVLIDPLTHAKQLFERDDYTIFYAELNRSLWNVVADKLNLPASELNKHNITLKLQSHGVDKETTDLLDATLNECEMKLYTPDYSTHDMKRILQNAEEIVQALNKA